MSKKTKSFAVIGLGRFGLTVAKTITELGHEVLGVDINEEVVQKASPQMTHAFIADTTDEDALKELGINNFDVVVVAIGDNLQANLLTILLLKELGVKYIVAKAQNQLQGRMLKKIGVDQLVYPERDMALRVAHSLTRDHVLDYFSLSDHISLVEMETPSFLVGTTLADSGLRQNYNVSVVALRKHGEVIAPPSPMEVLEKEDILMIIGKNEDVNRLDKME